MPLFQQYTFQSACLLARLWDKQISLQLMCHICIWLFFFPPTTAVLIFGSRMTKSVFMNLWRLKIILGTECIRFQMSHYESLEKMFKVTFCTINLILFTKSKKNNPSKDMFINLNDSYLCVLCLHVSLRFHKLSFLKWSRIP